MKSSWPTHNIKNRSTTLRKMNCLLALTHFKSMFHFYTPWEHKKPEVSWGFQEVWKWNIGLKLVEVILNNFMKGYLIFVYSYPQGELYLTLSWRRSLSYRNQSIDLQSKSVDWFLYDNGLRHERVNRVTVCCEWDLNPQLLD